MLLERAESLGRVAGILIHEEEISTLLFSTKSSASLAREAEGRPLAFSCPLHSEGKSALLLCMFLKLKGKNKKRGIGTYIPEGIPEEISTQPSCCSCTTHPIKEIWG